MSVVLADALEEEGRLPGSILADKDGYGLVALTAEEVRAEEQRVVRSPLPEEEAHGDVWGEKPAGRRCRFARLARWIVEPPL